MEDKAPEGFEDFKKKHPEFFPEDQPLQKQWAFYIPMKAAQQLTKAQADENRKTGFKNLDKAVEKKSKTRAGGKKQDERVQQKQREEHRKIDVTNLRLRDQTDRAIVALQADNDPPHTFVRSGGMVRIIHDEMGTPSIEICTPVILKYILARSAEFSRLRSDGSVKDISPPNEVVLDFLANRNWTGFLAIEGIIESPVILPDGTITTAPGYYEGIRMQYIPSPDLHLPDIPERPGPGDIIQAVNLLKEVFEDFPFCEEASRTNTIAALITAVLRPVIPGFVPLALIDKPQPGIGASLMTDVIAMVATGRSPGKMTAPTEEGEWRKLITARLSQGQGLIIIDNVDKRLVSGSLAAVLTSETWEDRILGQSAMIKLINHTVFIANGINVETGPDIARRVYWIRIDAQQARPDQRTNFHHPELLQWVKDKRGMILAAILTLARAWIQAGCPPPEGIPQVGSFEKWRGMVGGILGNAGITGFLANLEQFRERSDTLSSQWDSFLQALKEQFPGSFTMKEVKALLESYNDDRQSAFNDPKIRLCDVIPDDISLRDKDPSRAIGNALKRHADHVFSSGLVIRKDDTKIHHAMAWRVEKKG